MQSLWSATSASSSYDAVWCRWSYQDIQRWRLPSEWMRLHIWSGHAIWHTHPLWPNTRPPLTLNLSTWSWLAWKNRYCFSFIHPVSAAPHNCLYHIVWNQTRALSFVGQIYNICNFKDCYLSFFSMKEECVTIITVFGFHCISAFGPLIQMWLGQKLHECVSVWALLLIAWTGPENWKKQSLAFWNCSMFKQIWAMRESSILVMQHQTAHWPLYTKIIIMTRMKKYFRLATMYWKFFNQCPSRRQASDIWTNLDWASQSLNSDHQKWLYQSLRLKREYLRSKYIKPEFSIDWNSWADYYILIYAHPSGADEVSGYHGSSSLLFMMKVMVWHIVSNSHKVMTVLIFSTFNLLSWRSLYNFIHNSFPITHKVRQGIRCEVFNNWDGDGGICWWGWKMEKACQDVSQLSDLMEKPSNLDRWRVLPGRDNTTQELTGKAVAIEEFLSAKEDQAYEKDLILEEV